MWNFGKESNMLFCISQNIYQHSTKLQSKAQKTCSNNLVDDPRARLLFTSDMVDWKKAKKLKTRPIMLCVTQKGAFMPAYIEKVKIWSGVTDASHLRHNRI